ncbi:MULTISPECIES: protein glxC [Cupriavidus]|uniref:Protein glxC n=1 Tax=Cupriavidus metallidurans TaxID=119219 RepID=A0A482J568_9BURK|nr:MULTISPECIES: protein glxC [Cupriavidus]MWL91941.1 protein glxC [Cupriavidus sp. SW-Y-13]QBP14549.1 protein glxC [Cupriavidus metallidurans]
MESVKAPMKFDLAVTPLREVNQFLHKEAPATPGLQVKIENPNGAHAIAAGMNAPLDVTIEGHAGYYAAGMNHGASVTINGSAGTGVAENMMSGKVHVKGFASNAAGATAQGGLLVIDGDAGLRCAISLKGADVVVGGSVGSFSAFMAQAGNLVVLGDAGEALGDSLYEANIYVRGTVKSLGADCEEKPMGAAEREVLAGLLARAGHLDVDPFSFKRYGSARTLYNFHVDNAGAY